MKIKEGLKLRKVAGTPVVLKQGKKISDITSVISFNSTSEFLWNTFIEKDFSKEDIANALVKEYSIDEKRASEDAEKWIEKITQCGLVS
jgi:hypothetical protein